MNFDFCFVDRFIFYYFRVIDHCLIMSNVPALNISGLFSPVHELGPPDFVAEDFDPEKYQCVNGGHLLFPPVMQLACGHRICYSPCLDHLRHSLTNNTCPGGEEECLDVSVTEPDMVLPDVSFTKELSKAEIWCSNKSNGCSEKMAWKDLESHLRECLYKLISCRNAEYGCPEKLPASLLEDHERICLYVFYVCQHCGQQLLKLNRADHERDCIVQQGRCTLSPIGCEFTAKSMEDLQEHVQEKVVVHLCLIADECDRRQEDCVKLLGKINRMREGLSLNEVLAKVKQTSKEVKQKLDPKLKNTQKVAAKNSAMLSSVASLEEKFMLLKPLQETARASENKLNRLENDTPILDIPPAISNNMEHIQKSFDEHDKVVREMDLKFQCVENTSHDGVFIWKVNKYSEHKDRAKNQEILSLYSQPFYSGRFGYKICLRLYPNGDGIGKNTHISLYLVIMKGEMDALLPWPFKQKVAFTLLDQDTHRRHFTDNFRPDPTSTSFHKPKTEMNVASGLPLFLEQSKAESSTYLRDDCLFIKVEIV